MRGFRIETLHHRYGRRSVLILSLALAGCDKSTDHAPSVSDPPAVRVVHPQVRDIIRVVGQPSFVESYERTSIYPKMTAYIEKWNVDIGDRVKKDDVLATLFVPEIVEDDKTKKATVVLDKQRIDLAEKAVKVAEADVQAAAAHLDEAKSILAQYQAMVDRWDSEVKRLSREADRGVVAPQILLESQNQLKASTAQREAARATISKAEADLLSKQAAKDQSVVAVAVARANLAVAESDAKRMDAWVGYLTLTAPFDGIITARNANTGDFVLPATGDPSADNRAPDLSPSGTAAPIYVVDRTDVVRVFVDIPERDANYVTIGTPATVLIKAFRNQPIAGNVTRTSWALNVKSRTLRAEVDLPNTDKQILPGMYAYGRVRIERPGVRALPTVLLTHNGDTAYYWALKDGKVVRTEVDTGITDGEWIEVLNHRLPTADGVEHPWTPIDGTEQVIQGDLSILVDGETVRVVADKDDPAAAKPGSGAPK